MRMLRRYCVLLFAFFLAAAPLLGLAAQEAPACAHCQTAGTTHDGHCHHHIASIEKCHQCAGCAACAFMPGIQTGSGPIVQQRSDTVRIGYRSAHFYRLNSPPLDRPPSAIPA